MENSFAKYVANLFALRTAEGQTAEALGEEMDGLWRTMTPEEVELARKVSAALNSPTLDAVESAMDAAARQLKPAVEEWARSYALLEDGERAELAALSVRAGELTVQQDREGRKLVEDAKRAARKVADATWEAAREAARVKLDKLLRGRQVLAKTLRRLVEFNELLTSKDAQHTWFYDRGWKARLFGED